VPWGLLNAPMIQVNNEWVYEELTYEAVQEIITEWKEGREPLQGP